jgi:hypothetical protein
MAIIPPAALPLEWYEWYPVICFGKQKPVSGSSLARHRAQHRQAQGRRYRILKVVLALEELSEY